MRLKATCRLELDGNSSWIWGYTSNVRRARGSMDSENEREWHYPINGGCVSILTLN